jgi:hypothetical protein
LALIVALTCRKPKKEVWKTCQPTQEEEVTKNLFILIILFLVNITAFVQSMDATWVRRYNERRQSSDRAFAMVMDCSGNVCVMGYGFGRQIGYDYATVKYDTTGYEVWVKRCNWGNQEDSEHKNSSNKGRN